MSYRRSKHKAVISPVLPRTMLKPAELRAIGRHNALDRRFRPVNRYLERWAAGQGSDLPISAEEADGLPKCQPPPLPSDEAVIADQTILHSPPEFRRLVFSWYRSPKPADVIADELGISKRAVYHEIKLVLAYLLGRFHESGLKIPTWEADT